MSQEYWKTREEEEKNTHPFFKDAYARYYELANIPLMPSLFDPEKMIVDCRNFTATNYSMCWLLGCASRAYDRDNKCREIIHGYEVTVSDWEKFLPQLGFKIESIGDNKYHITWKMEGDN